MISSTTYGYSTVFSTTYQIDGVHTGNSTSTYTQTQTSTSTYTDITSVEYTTTTTYTYTETSSSTYTTYTTTQISTQLTSTNAVATVVSSSSTYNTTEVGFSSATSYTADCDIAYQISTSSSTYNTNISPYGVVSVSVYETTTHNSPFPHTISEESYSSAIYSTSSTYDVYTETTTSSTYTDWTIVWTTDTWTSNYTTTLTNTTNTTTFSYEFTTITYTYNSTVNTSSTSTYSETVSYSIPSYETVQNGTTISETQFISNTVSQSGFTTIYSSLESFSKISIYTATYVGYYDYNFSYISQVWANYTSSWYSSYISRSSLISYSGTRTPTGTTNTYYQNSTSYTVESWSNGGSFSYSGWGGASSNTTSTSQSSYAQNGYSTSSTTIVGPITLTKSINSYTSTYVNTTLTSSTTNYLTYNILTGITLSGGQRSTTTTTASDLFTTSTTQTTQSLSWTEGSSYSVSNSVSMGTAYVFEPMVTERMFSLSATTSSFVEFSKLVKETTQYKAIPNYTTNYTSVSNTYYVIDYSSFTVERGTTGTAFVISNYNSATPGLTISETGGTKLSPVGAYGYPSTTISYGVGIYDITSRSMSNASIGTNTTFQTTITASTVEYIQNADKKIYPRLTIVSPVTTSSITVFSLLGVFGFGTTSLANP